VSEVRIAPLDTRLLAELLRVAVAGAEPWQVMPPVGSGSGWTEQRRAAFLRFHAERLDGLAGAHRTAMYAILADGPVAGMIRMTAREPMHDAVTVMETGMWLGRTVRSRGIGTAALRALLVEAVLAGADAVVAETTVTNLAAVGTLRRCGALLGRDGDAVLARIPLARPADSAPRVPAHLPRRATTTRAPGVPAPGVAPPGSAP
jgi:RimJ/RimL family protein N-acetyltransferase